MNPSPARPSTRRRALLFGLLVALVLFARPAWTHVRAASLLVRFTDERATGVIAGLGTHPVDELPAVVPTSRGEVKARLYVPRDLPGAPGVVLVHGVHRLGIEEPRLQRFSRAVAASGVVVLTPEVAEIADYRVDPVSIETIGAAARALRSRLGGARAGVMGMSFAGGLSLLAAADPRFAGDIGFVVAIGAHHDLARVSRFFATDRIGRPDGSTLDMKAHGYGTLVLVYSRVEQFFPAADVPAARDAIRAFLWERIDEAKARARDLTPEGRATLEALLDHRLDAVAPRLLETIARDEAAMATVSPRGHLAGIAVPVFLLHGAGDSVIPAVETTWIASEVPAGRLRSALVSPAVVHVELQGEPPLSEKWALVHFMATILDEAAAAR